jgi:hypothetical protein
MWNVFWILPNGLLYVIAVTILTPWRYSSCRTLAASYIPLYVRFRDEFLQRGIVSPTPNPPTWRTRVSLLVWHLPRNLSGMGGPTSSYAAAGIALEFIVVHKPPHPARKCFRQGGGDTIERAVNIIVLNFPKSELLLQSCSENEDVACF